MREVVGKFGGRRDTQEKSEESSKRGKLSTTKLESSQEAHIQGKRILDGPEIPSLRLLGWI